MRNASACTGPAELLDQIGRGARRAAGGEQVVDDQHALPLLHGVLVDLERVGAVLELVGRADARRRQLARLAHRREAGADAGRRPRAPKMNPRLSMPTTRSMPLIRERQRRGVDRRAEARPDPAAAS